MYLEEGGPVVGEISFGDDGDSLSDLNLELGLAGEVDHDGDDLVLDGGGGGVGKGCVLGLQSRSTFSQ